MSGPQMKESCCRWCQQCFTFFPSSHSFKSDEFPGQKMFAKQFRLFHQHAHMMSVHALTKLMSKLVFEFLLKPKSIGGLSGISSKAFRSRRWRPFQCEHQMLGPFSMLWNGWCGETTCGCNRSIGWCCPVHFVVFLLVCFQRIFLLASSAPLAACHLTATTEARTQQPLWHFTPFVLNPSIVVSSHLPLAISPIFRIIKLVQSHASATSSLTEKCRTSCPDGQQ